jgi:hypothetical protein
MRSLPKRYVRIFLWFGHIRSWTLKTAEGDRPPFFSFLAPARLSLAPISLLQSAHQFADMTLGTNPRFTGQSLGVQVFGLLVPQ